MKIKADKNLLMAVLFTLALACLIVAVFIFALLEESDDYSIADIPLYMPVIRTVNVGAMPGNVTVRRMHDAEKGVICYQAIGVGFSCVRDK